MPNLYVALVCHASLRVGPAAQKACARWRETLALMRPDGAVAFFSLAVAATSTQAGEHHRYTLVSQLLNLRGIPYRPSRLAALWP
jgi:hypothetical protein